MAFGACNCQESQNGETFWPNSRDRKKAFSRTNQKDACEFILVLMKALHTIIHLQAYDTQVQLYPTFTSNCPNHSSSSKNTIVDSRAIC